jgi:uncharacterized protein HemX
MTGTEVGLAERIASSPAAWAILFILMLIGAVRFLQWYVKSAKVDSERREAALINLYEQQRVDSQKREEHLMNHLDKTTKSLEGIEKNLTGLEQKLNTSLKDIWNHLHDRRGQ